MACRKTGGGQCLLRAMTAEHVAAIPCSQIQKSLDIIGEGVLNCSAREAVYNCVKTTLPYVSIIHCILVYLCTN